MEKLVIINLNDNEYRKAQNIAGRMKLQTERIECRNSSDYDATLEEISAGKFKGQPQSDNGSKNESDVADKSLILLCGLREKRLDKVLFELRRAEVSADFKAVLTPTNKNWSLRKLFAELGRERAAMEKSGD